MNLKKDYADLYRHWLAEFDQTKLTPFFQEDFNLYKNLLNKIKATEFQGNDSIKEEILDSYKKNIEYLLEDLLKIRKIKIMNTALSLQEINLEYLLEPEKLLYQNLIRSVKGYDKLRKLSTIENYPTENLTIESLSSTESTEQKESESKPKLEGKIDLQKINRKEKIEPSGPDIGKETGVKINTEYNYTVIRFLKNTPPLVGIDLKNYGPFKENDLASMPYKNAIILFNEKFAEKVDLT